jgi:nitrous oxidase accessory protein NosD
MKARIVGLFTCLYLCLLFSSTCLPVEAGIVIRVPSDQSTIQNAIIAASNGDIVQVARGTYVENLNFLGKAIRVTSEEGAAVTIIDGNRSGSVVTFSSAESRLSVLDGFTLQNGKAPTSGGGIQIINSSPTVSGNVIRNNSAASDGGWNQHQFRFTSDPGQCHQEQWPDHRVQRWSRRRRNRSPGGFRRADPEQ